MRKNRTYSLFEKRDGKWVRVSPMTLPLDRARVVFQGRLLDATLSGTGVERMLRPATNDFQQETVSLVGSLVNRGGAYDTYYNNVKPEDKPLQT